MWIRHGKPAVILAPMEGVTDAPMRAMLTEIGGFSHCVSEFIRVSQDPLPKKVFLASVPELRQGAKTPSGVDVQLQLLGGNPELLAISAVRACEAGSPGIDLNFGCPAPTVNRHDGGATLLKYPERIEKIVRAVRDAVPAHLPVSAKLRLGWDSIDAIHENAKRAEQGGADWIAIHGRTKVAGYTPPAYWEPIGKVREAVSVPVIANGELWTMEDFETCRKQTGCEHYMLGRSALADPFLASRIAERLGTPTVADRSGSMSSDLTAPLAWKTWLERFAVLCTEGEPLEQKDRYVTHRIKQWIRFAKMRGVAPWFEELKLLQSTQEILAFVSRSGVSPEPEAIASPT